MKQTTKIQSAVFIVTLVLLITIWAVTGFKDTWLYIALVPVIVPNSWWLELINKLSKKDKDQ